MVGNSTFEAAIVCLGSLHHFCSDPIELTVLSDGTLSPEQRDRLTRLPHTRMADDSRLKEDVAARLASFPLLRKTYEENVYLKKLVDIPILAGQACCFIDSDILFFRPVGGLFESHAHHGRIAEDRSVTPGIRDLLTAKGRLHGCLNCGFIDTTFPSLADAERVLRQWRDTRFNVIEQLVWSVAKNSAPLDYVTLESIYIPRPKETLDGFRPSPSAFAIHLTNWRKRHAAELREKLAPHAGDTPRIVSFSRRKPSAFWWLLVLKITRRITGHS